MAIYNSLNNGTMPVIRSLFTVEDLIKELIKLIKDY